MTGLAFVCGVLPMAIATGAGGASQQALGTSVMGGMIAVVILALLMVPVFFVSVQRVLAGDREKVEEAAAAEVVGPPAPVKSIEVVMLRDLATPGLRRVCGLGPSRSLGAGKRPPTEAAFRHLASGSMSGARTSSQAARLIRPVDLRSAA